MLYQTVIVMPDPLLTCPCHWYDCLERCLAALNFAMVFNNKSLVHAFVTSRLDHGNALLAGLSRDQVY